MTKRTDRDGPRWYEAEKLAVLVKLLGQLVVLAEAIRGWR